VLLMSRNMLQRASYLLACVVMTGCLDEAAQTPVSTPTAREQFDSRAWNALAACAACHGKQPGIDFLAPGTASGAYESLFAFQPPVIDLDVPGSSLLLTMGKHTGPAMSNTAAAPVLEWLQAERDQRVTGTDGTWRPDGSQPRRDGPPREHRGPGGAGPSSPAPATPITLDLGVTGATLTIVTEASERGLYAKRITLTSGTGIRLTHPLFVSRPLHPILDESDRFGDLDLQLGAGKTVELGPAWFFSFDPADYVAIHFATLEAP